ncbi:hypothetical protein L1887_61802 [Cichorium endivia]|nr:hypothetical protein L1887_61802 [Cichorium endivia]
MARESRHSGGVEGRAEVERMIGIGSVDERNVRIVQRRPGAHLRTRLLPTGAGVKVARVREAALTKRHIGLDIHAAVHLERRLLPLILLLDGHVEFSVALGRPKVVGDCHRVWTLSDSAVHVHALAGLCPRQSQQGRRCLRQWYRPGGMNEVCALLGALRLKSASNVRRQRLPFQQIGDQHGRGHACRRLARYRRRRRQYEGIDLRPGRRRGHLPINQSSLRAHGEVTRRGWRRRQRVALALEPSTGHLLARHVVQQRRPVEKADCMSH